MAATESTDAQHSESRPFEADVAKLLHLMVHSVYSDKSVFLRELIANAADACERLRFEAIATPSLLGDDAKPRITIALDPAAPSLTVEDNGIGMSRDEMIEALGTIARSGTAGSASVFIRHSWWRIASRSFRAAPVRTPRGCGRPTARAIFRFHRLPARWRQVTVRASYFI